MGFLAQSDWVCHPENGWIYLRRIRVTSIPEPKVPSVKALMYQVASFAPGVLCWKKFDSEVACPVTMLWERLLVAVEGLDAVFEVLAVATRLELAVGLCRPVRRAEGTAL